MTVSVSNTNLGDSFNTWRLNTNLLSTIVSNNVVTVSRAGSAERGGVAKGNSHIAGTFTANELRTVRLRSGNTSSTGNFVQIASNTAINATSFSVTANAIFQGNVNFATSGANRLILGDISRVRVTGGSQGQFLKIEGGADTPSFSTLSLRDIQDLSTNSANFILSGANSTFSPTGDSPSIIFAEGSGTQKAYLYLEANTTLADKSDVVLKLTDINANATFRILNSVNTEKFAVRADGTVFATSNVTAGGITTSENILPIADDSVDIGSPNREFRNAYFDGTVTTDVITTGTAASQGVGSSLIPVTDALGNLGSTTRKWGTVWADNTNGGAGVFSSVGISGNFTANGTATFNGGFALNGSVDLGSISTDTVTFVGGVDSDVLPVTDDGVGHYDLGTTARRWNRIYANTVYANTIVSDNNVTVKGNFTVEGNTSLASGKTFTSPIGSFANLTVTSTARFNGTTFIGNESADTLTISAEIASHLIPDADGTYDLGSMTTEWRNLYLDGTATIDTLNVDVDTTLGGHRATVSGNVHIGDTVILTNGIKDGATTIVGKNGKIHANNAVDTKTITTTMIANTMTSGGNFGSATQVPIFQVNDRGQITGIRETQVAAVTGLTYTQSNNNIRISSADGSTFDDTIESATTTSDTGRGVASFDSGDFDVTSGHVVLKNATTGAVLTVNGTANEVNVARTNGTVTVGLPDDVTVTGQLNVGENIVVSGNLVVQGTTTTVNSETVRIADNIIVLNSNETGTPSQDGGITIERGTATNYSFTFNEANDRWTLGDRNLVANTFIGNLTGDVTGNVTGTVIGSADTLTTARSIGISLSGDVTGSGSANFDGSGDITITASNLAVQPNSIALGTDTVGNYMVGVSAGNLTNITHTPSEGSTATIDVDLSELTSMSETILGTDFFVVIDGSAQRKKVANTIPISIFNNDSSFLSGTDQRGNIYQIGRDTNDYYHITATDHHAWFLGGDEEMRLSNTGQLDVEGNIVAHSATVSDTNLKENIEKVTDAVSKVQKLNGYTFNYKKDGRLGAGILAQEVEEVLPSAVQKTEILGHDGEYLVVEYDQLTSLLIESIKELKAEIDELKKTK